MSTEPERGDENGDEHDGRSTLVVALLLLVPFLLLLLWGMLSDL